jgi:phosphotransacetylase/acyl dehydratase
MANDQLIENRTFDEIAVGETASLSRTLTEHDIASFAAVSGGIGRAEPVDELSGVVAHGMLGSALISTVLGTRLPGPGTIYLRQELDFLGPMRLGDTIDITVAVAEKGDGRHVTLDCRCVDRTGKLLTKGRAVVVAPAEKLRVPLAAMPQMIVQTHDSFERLMRANRDVPPVPCAVAHPCSPDALEGAIDAAAAGVILPILVGPRAKVLATAEGAGVDIGGYELVDVPHSHAAADRAVELVREGRAHLLMKGSLHTDELMGAVVAKETGLRTAARISHVFVMDVPTYAKPLFITDAAINIFPTLDEKADIVRNAIDLFRGLGLGTPRVAILSALETVSAKIPGTIEAAALCKMADRGQITGGILDGPLALDNAIDLHAAEIKGIVSEVAGRADILVVPDLEAGNMLAKNLSFMAHADSAGVVVGARVPIILTSRADSVRARLASAAVAALYAHNKRLQQPVAG